MRLRNFEAPSVAEAMQPMRSAIWLVAPGEDAGEGEPREELSQRDGARGAEARQLVA